MIRGVVVVFGVLVIALMVLGAVSIVLWSSRKLADRRRTREIAEIKRMAGPGSPGA